MESPSAFIFCSLLLALAVTPLASPLQQPLFPSIFAFGDSLTDPGNYLISQNYSVDQVENHLPYGITFFHKPTGRFSDGRLVVDFVAQRLRAPLLKPYLSLLRGQSGTPAFEDRFVNFAVAGATAQSAAFLKAQNIVALTPLSLDVQLNWFKHFLGGAKEVHLPKALIFFGEIGDNDYNYAVASGKTFADILSSVSNVTAQIKNSLQKFIKDGAKYIIVEGAKPLGCAPEYRQVLNAFPKDQFGCIQVLDEISQKHNKQLQKVIRHLIKKYPHVSIAYFDFEAVNNEVLKRPGDFGFRNTTSACYDVIRFITNTSIPFNMTAFQEVKACPNPSKYISWDGIHSTEAMYKAATLLFFEKGFVDPYPNFLTKRVG